MTSPRLLVLLACVGGCVSTAPPPEKKADGEPPSPILLRQMPLPDSLPGVNFPDLAIVPLVDQPPEMDGNAEAKPWKGAVALEDFVLLNRIVERAALALRPGLRPWEYAAALMREADDRGNIPAAQKTSARLCYDRNALHVFFRCADTNVVGQVQQSDGPVWMDDCVEMFIDPQSQGAQIFHIVVNARGTKFDEKFHRDVVEPPKTGPPVGRRWDCKMSFITGRTPEGWWAQMAIPFESLGVKRPESGAMWSVNLARWNNPASLHGGVEFNEITTWAPADVSAAESESFGRIYFDRGPPAVVQRLSAGLPGEGVNTACVTLRELSGKGTRARLIVSTQTEAGDLVETASRNVNLDPEARMNVNLAYKVPPDLRRCFLAATLIAESGEHVLDSAEMPLHIEAEPLAIQADQRRFFANAPPIRFMVNVNKGEVSAGLYGLRVAILQEEKELASRRVERLESQRVEAVIDTRDIPAGSYLLQAQLLQQGKPVAEANADIEILHSPFVP